MHAPPWPQSCLSYGGRREYCHGFFSLEQEYVVSESLQMAKYVADLSG